LVTLPLLALAACQTTGTTDGPAPTASSAPAPAPSPGDEGQAAAPAPAAAQPRLSEGDIQEERARQAGFTQITNDTLRSLVSGHTYAYDHPRGARITMSFSPNGTATGTWTHPAGLTGDFTEKWVIQNGEDLCGIGDEGTKCGSLFRKDDLLVKIYDSGRVDRLDPIENVATK
jgi:hypothetical protein